MGSLLGPDFWSHIRRASDACAGAKRWQVPWYGAVKKKNRAELNLVAPAGAEEPISDHSHPLGLF